MSSTEFSKEEVKLLRKLKAAFLLDAKTCRKYAYKEEARAAKHYAGVMAAIIKGEEINRAFDLP